MNERAVVSDYFLSTKDVKHCVAFMCICSFVLENKNNKKLSRKYSIASMFHSNENRFLDQQRRLSFLRELNNYFYSSYLYHHLLDENSFNTLDETKQRLLIDQIIIESILDSCTTFLESKLKELKEFNLLKDSFETSIIMAQRNPKKSFKSKKGFFYTRRSNLQKICKKKNFQNMKRLGFGNKSKIFFNDKFSNRSGFKNNTKSLSLKLFPGSKTIFYELKTFDERIKEIIIEPPPINYHLTKLYGETSNIRETLKTMEKNMKTMENNLNHKLDLILQHWGIKV